MEKWAENKGGAEYLTNKLGDKKLTIFTSAANNDKGIATRKYSFKDSGLSEGTYAEFLQFHEEDKVQGVSLKTDDVMEELKEDIKIPEFYEDVSDLHHFMFFQGAHFVDLPHYIKMDQLLCAIDGAAAVILRPHINRQELYAGDFKGSVYFEERVKKSKQQNISPVNFFMPDLEKFPLFKDTVKHNVVHLGSGDCLYIPSFYYYHFQGFRQMNPNYKHTGLLSGIQFPKEYYQKNETTMEEAAESEKYTTKIATVVSMRFEGNSKLLENFFDAIESRVIK